MRAVWLPIVTVGLVAVACSDDTTRASEPATSATTTATTTATNPTAVAGDTSAPDAATTTVDQPTVVPEVVCVAGAGELGNEFTTADRVYFAYSNEGSTPVVIEAGAANVVDGALADDVPLAPTLFAPGRVSPAFWAFAPESGESAPSWTLTGPDGEARTATPDASTPACTDQLMAPTTADTRAPELTFSYRAPSESSPEQIELLATVTGVDAASVCAPGLEPLAPVVWTDDSDGGSQTEGATVRRTLLLEQATDPLTNETSLFARTRLSALVVDACGADDSVSLTWPTGASFERLRNGVVICIRASGGQTTMEIVDEPFSCGPGLPSTGGMRIRTGPPT